MVGPQWLDPRGCKAILVAHQGPARWPVLISDWMVIKSLTYILLQILLLKFIGIVGKPRCRHDYDPPNDTVLDSKTSIYHCSGSKNKQLQFLSNHKTHYRCQPTKSISKPQKKKKKSHSTPILLKEQGQNPNSRSSLHFEIKGKTQFRSDPKPHNPSQDCHPKLDSQT